MWLAQEPPISRRPGLRWRWVRWRQRTISALLPRRQWLQLRQAQRTQDTAVHEMKGFVVFISWKKQGHHRKKYAGIHRFMLTQASLCLLPQQMVNCEFPPPFFLHLLPAHLTGPSTYRLLETREQVSLSSFPARSLTRFSHSHIVCARVPSHVCGLYDLCTCVHLCI